MNQQKDDRWLDTMLSEHLERDPAVFNREKWAERCLRHKGTEPSRFKVPTRPPKTTIPLIWRNIMKSPFTRAAAVLIVFSVVLSYLFPSPNGLLPESVAWGDVLDALGAQESVAIDGSAVCTLMKKPSVFPPGQEALFEKMLKEADDGRFTVTMRSEIYISARGYANLVYTEDGEPLIHIALDQETGIVTVLFPTAKVYIRFTASQTVQEAMSKFTMKGFLTQLFLSENHQAVESKRIRGIEAQGFEVTDLHDRLFGDFNPKMVAFLFKTQQMRACAWIDPDSKLPLQVEGEIDLAPCALSMFEQTHIRCIKDRFTWGVDIDASTFLPAIPEDYKQVNPLAPVKQTAWIGLLPIGVLGYRRWSKRQST